MPEPYPVFGRLGDLGGSFFQIGKTSSRVGHKSKNSIFTAFTGARGVLAKSALKGHFLAKIGSFLRRAKSGSLFLEVFVR